MAGSPMTNVLYFPSPCENKCGHPSDGVFESAPGKTHRLCNVCGHGGGWCELCNKGAVVTFRDLGETPDDEEHYAVCSACSAFGLPMS